MFPSAFCSRTQHLFSQVLLSTTCLLVLLLGATFSGQAATLDVPAGGNVQAAVNAAQCGDTITLQAGVSFPINGRLTFSNKGACSQFITLTTTDPGSIPAALGTAYPNSYSNGTFTRLTPAMAASMPKLVALTNDPIVYLEPNAHHWKFVGIEFTTADNGVQHTMLVGDGSNGAHDIPHHITWDRCFFHPVEEIGDLTTNIQYRSTEMAFIISGDSLTISNSAIQGFTGHNRWPLESRGSYRLNANSLLFIRARNTVVENNLLEANGQIFLAGDGAVNPAHTAAATNVTYTSATFSNTTNLDVGDLFAIYNRRYSNNHIIQHPGNPTELVPRVGHYVNGKILSVNHATGAVTFTPLTGGLAYRHFNVRLWGASGGTFTLTWMGQTTAPIPYNTSPAGIRTALEALSNLNPEDFYVRSSAQGWPYGDFEIHIGRNDLGQPSGQWQYPTPVNPFTINYSNLIGYAYQPWIAVHSAENYSPLENSADGTLIDVPDEGANVQWEGFTSDNNTFRRNIIAHHPEWTAVTGSVKGFAEIKGGTRTYFDGNIFSGEGTTIIWTVRNQGDGGSAPWSDDSYSQITNNIFDVTGYTNGFFLRDATYENIESHDILLSNNLFVGPDMAHPNPWINLVSGYNVTITHNTVFGSDRIVQGISPAPSRNAVIKNNIFRPANYVFPCVDGPGPCWPNATVSHNLILNNLGLGSDIINSFFDMFGSGAGWTENSLGAVGFTSPSPLLDVSGNYRLTASSPYKAGGARQASDGKDVGVDFDQLYYAIFRTGNPPPPPPPTPSPTPVSTPTPTGHFQLSSPIFHVFEGGGSAHVTVERTNSTGAASVDYQTSDTAGLIDCSVVNGVASARCDYTIAVGTLRFAPGENAKSISIPIVDDGYGEQDEDFSITLSNANGATLDSPSVATITIQNNATNEANPIDSTAFFVRQQYLDFLNREPDPGGYEAWQQIINNCEEGDTGCDRIQVSSAFFNSPEFQDRGYFVYRFYPVSFGRKPDYTEFTPDIAKVSGFLTDAELNAAKEAFIAEFMSRPEFATKFNRLTNTQYVDTLLETAGIISPNRDFWIAALGNGTRTRATVLREISESHEVYLSYYNQAFVVMQYFGYLRRDPDASYVDWIQVLNSSGDFRGMVFGFINSPEYRSRLGP